jgi:hypothetical protein
MRHHGLTEQETYDRIQEMIRDRYRQWYLALAKLLIYGEEVDRQVHSYLKGVENIILANANWRYVKFVLTLSRFACKVSLSNMLHE